MEHKNEKQLLLVIKYALPILILFLSAMIITFLYYENKIQFENIKKNTEIEFIKHQKHVIKNQVENLYNYIVSEQKETENKLKDSLIKRTKEAHTIATNIYNQYKKTHSKEELTLMIRTALKDIRFNNDRGYFFVYDKKAINIIHPLLPHLEGKSLINYKDTKGTYVLKESLELLKDKDESYQEWYWRKTKGDLTEYKKIGFVKNIYELDWFLGTGEYVEDFSKDMQSRVLTQIEKLKFGDNSYFIVTDKNNNYLSHINKDLIGKNALQKLRDINDEESIKKIEDVINKEEGYVYLQFYKPNTTEISFKIIYLKTVPKWNWIISTGFYKDDLDLLIAKEEKLIEKRYEDTLNNLLVITFLVTIALLILSFYLSKIIKEKFKNYKTSIEHHIKENEKQYELLAQKTKLAAMGEMMENIAHQWRQPLSIISTASTGIKLHKEMNTLDDKLLLDSIDNITDSAKHLSSTIEDFRDFFRPDKEKTIFTLENAVKKTLNLINTQLTSRNIEIIKNIENISLEGFERELLQVLLNILNNAKDALEKIDGKKYIFINIFKENNKIIIKIKDNANGVPKNIIKRIFEPYFTTKHKSQGTGIGLYMSQEIVTRHMDGKIYVENSNFEFENNKYKGAVFIVELPLED